MLAKIEFFEVYRVLWVLEFVDTDLEDHHLQIKYFTSIKCCLSLCWRSDHSLEADERLNFTDSLAQPFRVTGVWT